jgi:hypothetical protein
MLIGSMPDSSIVMSMRYAGKDVDDGTMPVDEVLTALQGFAGAYGKVATALLPESKHEIRISAFKNGSFDVHIVGWITSKEGQEALKALKDVGGAALTIFAVIKGYIALKKHTKARPYEVNIEGSNNTVIVLNADGEKHAISKESYSLLQSKLIDQDLQKIVKPLEEGHIDKATLSIASRDDTPTVISTQDKASFAVSVTETFQDASLVGTLISNNKETRKGTFQSGSGDRVPYHYTGSSPELFQSTYTFSGKVRVSGTAYFDENLKLKRIDIHDAVKIQGELDFS